MGNDEPGDRAAPRPLRVAMMGTGTFAEPTFDALLASAHPVVGLVTQPDKAVGEKRGSTRQVGRGMKEIASERGIPVLQPLSVNAPEGLAALRALNADLLVVAAYGQILSDDVLGASTYGGINVHASLLPRHRGAAPVAWAILRGDAQTGVSIIRMTRGLDAGDVVATAVVDVDPNETAGELEARLAPLGAKLAVETADRLARGPVVGAKQDLTLVTRAPKLKKEMGLVDWSAPAPAVWNQIRAMQPWPTAYAYLHRPGFEPLRLMIARAAATPPLASGASPGTAERDGARLVVACGAGTALELLDVQPAGKRRMSAADFVRGAPLPAGSRFGAELG